MTEHQTGLAKRVIPAVAAAAILCAGAALTAHCADWPRFRGPNGDSISGEADWNPAAIADAAKVLWNINVSGGFSSVAVKGQRFYTMGNANNTDFVGCFNVDNGEPIWRHSYPCRPPDHPGPRATPFIDGDVVYTFSSSGDLFCLEAENGKVKWEKHLGSEMGVKGPQWGFAGSALIDGDMVIVNAGKHGMAFNKNTGERIWASQPSVGGYSTPVVYEIGGRRCLAIFGQKAVYGVDMKTGEELWSHPWVTSYDVNAADPIVFGNNVFITSGYGRGCALLDISSGSAKLVWENKTIASQFSSCVLIDGCIYGISGNAGRGILTCIDARTGAVKWTENLGFGGLMAAAGKLIVLNERGGLFVAEVNPSSYKEIARGQAVPRAQGVFWTAPVLANGRIYCRSSLGQMVCIDVSK